MDDHSPSLDDEPRRVDLDASSPFTLPGFFSALGDGTLVAGLCTDCSTRLLPPRPYCYACGSGAVTLETQPMTGTVFSYTEVRRPPEGFVAGAPYTVAVVELDSGARLTGRVKAPYDDVEIGQSVQVVIEEAPIDRDARLPNEDSWLIPVFELR